MITSMSTKLASDLRNLLGNAIVADEADTLAAQREAGMLATRQRNIAKRQPYPDLPNPVQAPAIVPAAVSLGPSAGLMAANAGLDSSGMLLRKFFRKCEAAHTRSQACRICCLYTISTPLHDGRDGGGYRTRNAQFRYWERSNAET